jgi:hypothetical protein
MRDEAYHPTGAGIAGDDQNDAGHEGGKDEAVMAMRGDDVEHHDDECPGRAADLGPRAAQQRNEEAGDNGGEQALVRRSAAGDAERHCKRKGDHRHGQAGDRIGLELAQAIALADHGRELGRELRPPDPRLAPGGLSLRVRQSLFLAAYATCAAACSYR